MHGEDGNLIALSRYEQQYQKEMEAQDILLEQLEERRAETIACMLEDKEYEGKECFCCGETIRGKGYISGDISLIRMDITYYFYCEDCKDLAR